jgi:cytoskeletal protein RodZ
MGEFGKDLRREREARGVALEAIAHGTKVSGRYLHALEQGAFTELPGGVFNKGIVRAYVRFLDLDEAVWIERYEACPGAAGAAADWSAFAQNVRRNRIQSRRRNTRRWLGVVAMVVGLLGLGWAVWKYMVQPYLEPQPDPQSTAQVMVGGPVRAAGKGTAVQS